MKRDATYDWSGAPYEILSQRAEGRINSLSQEVRFQGTTGPAEWVVGAYYANDKVIDTNQTLLGQNANVGAVRALILQLGLLNTPFNSPGYTATDVAQSFRTYRDTANFDVETMSAFASADWTLTPTLKLTTGIRYTKDRQDYVGCSRDFNGSMLPNVNLFNRAFFFQVYGAFTAPIATRSVRREANATHRLRTESTGPVMTCAPSFQPRVQCIPQPVAEQIDGQRQDDQRERREQQDPPFAGKQKLLADADQRAERGLCGRHADAEV